MNLIYLAHAVRPIGRETVRENIESALFYLRATNDALIGAGIDAHVIAPWIANVEAWDYTEPPAIVEAAILANLAVVARCDAILLCGDRLSAGMEAELLKAREAGLIAWDGIKTPPRQLADELVPFARARGWIVLPPNMGEPIDAEWGVADD